MHLYAQWVLTYKRFVLGFMFIASVTLCLQIRHLHVTIDPNALLPNEHPVVQATQLIEHTFGLKRVVVIGVSPRHGTVFQPVALRTVQNITRELSGTPGVIKNSVLSLTARRAKNIRGDQEGLVVRPLLEIIPESPEELAALRDAVHNNPIYIDSIVSRDDKTTAILAEFRDSTTGFLPIAQAISQLLAKHAHEEIVFHVSGLPMYFAKIEEYSQRMGILFPLAVLIIGLLHFSAFHSLQALILPLVTALLSVIWSLGFMALAGVPLDSFNVTTPILILALSAGHSVQMLKRYYEEYHHSTSKELLGNREASHIAIVRAMETVGPVLIAAGMIASMSFFSLMTFKTATIRTFGLFTGLGVMSAVLLELTLIPAIRSSLPLPNSKHEAPSPRSWWDFLLTRFQCLVLSTTKRKYLYLVVAFALISAAVGADRVIIDNSNKGYFSSSLPFQIDDRYLNSALAGTNTLNILIRTSTPDGVKDPILLQSIEKTIEFLSTWPHIGKSIAITSFLKKLNQSFHNDDPTFYALPDTRDLISQYLFLYSLTGDPDDFSNYVDSSYQDANIRIFLKTDSSAYISQLIEALNPHLKAVYPDNVVTMVGGSASLSTALTDVMVHGKLVNILQIGVIVMFTTACLFRSITAGLIIASPLALAVMMNFGLMGFAGIKLNIATAVISALAVGIGADYAVYFTYRVQEEIGKGHTLEKAIAIALETAGKAILFVASAVVAGYLVLLFSSGFYLHIWSSILICAAMVTTAVGTLTLVPSLLQTLCPSFLFKSSVALKPRLAVFVLAIGVVISSSASHAHAAEEPTEIMKRNFMSTRVISSISDGTFSLIDASGAERKRVTLGVTKLQPNGIDNMRMVRFLFPPDIRNFVTLLIEHTNQDDDIWVYLPALKKARRIIASNKKDSFAGTDFSYGDVIGHKVDEWHHRLVGEETIDGEPCYMMESIPRDDTVKANSGYSKRLNWIRQSNFVTSKGQAWDLNGELLKTWASKELKLVDAERNRWQPMRQEAVNLQSGHRTVITYSSFRTDSNVKDDDFTVRYMEREQ